MSGLTAEFELEIKALLKKANGTLDSWLPADNLLVPTTLVKELCQDWLERRSKTHESGLEVRKSLKRPERQKVGRPL